MQSIIDRIVENLKKELAEGRVKLLWTFLLTSPTR